MRFQPSDSLRWAMKRGVMLRLSSGAMVNAARTPPRWPVLTFLSTERSGCTASMYPAK